MIAAPSAGRWVWRLAFATGIALAAAAVTAQDRDIARLEAGRLLYAAPGLPDPNFAESVVLLVEHTPKGSSGLIVNVPTSATVGEAVPELSDLRGARLAVYRGGPVRPTHLLFLIRSRQPMPKLTRVEGDVYLGGRAEDLREALGRGDALENVRVYAGYAGWGSEQLETELQHGGWVVGARDPQAAFSADPASLWPRVHRLLKRIEAWFQGRTQGLSGAA